MSDMENNEYFDKEIASAYKNRFPHDKIIICDAYQFLLEHFKEYDFIWASPPCQSHNRTKYSRSQEKPYYIDMGLYQIILFLQCWCKNKKWCVENVFPYYEPLIQPSYILERHYLWTNFIVNVRNRKSCQKIEKSTISMLLKYHNVNDNIFKKLSIDSIKKRQVLRNCCSSWFSEIIENCYEREKNEKHFQLSLDI